MIEEAIILEIMDASILQKQTGISHNLIYAINIEVSI